MSMKITPEEFKRHETIWDMVLDTLLGLDHFTKYPYHEILMKFKERYSNFIFKAHVERLHEIEYWMKARLFNKFYTEKYEQPN